MAEAVGILEVFGLATAFVRPTPAARQQMSIWRFLIKINLQMRTVCRYRSLSASSSAEAFLM